jgi:hypothetical protein
MARKPTPTREEGEDLSEQLTIRVSPSDVNRLDKLAGLAARSIIARLALQIGMQAIEDDPALLKQARVVRPGRKPKRAE